MTPSTPKWLDALDAFVPPQAPPPPPNAPTHAVPPPPPEASKFSNGSQAAGGPSPASGPTPQPPPPPPPQNEPTSEQAYTDLDSRKFDVHKPPPPLRPVFFLDGMSIATPGNLVAIQAPAKAGKTAFLGALIAATMSSCGDCFGVKSANPNGHALVHFDFEQSPNDHHNCCKTALKRAGLAEPPPWFRSYCLTDMPLAWRWFLFQIEMERAKSECGGLLAAILDGVADVCADPNDAKEAFALVDKLHQMAIRYDTAFICVLHENPGSETGKMRGHLGSQLERKAESNIRLAKDGEGVTVVYTEKARHAHIPKDKGPRFQWSDIAHMHVSTEARCKERHAKKQDTLRNEAFAVFEGAPSSGLSWSDLHRQIAKILCLSHSGARRPFDDMVKFGIIRKVGNNYELVRG